ncbi:helix-turn-helix domain-containing protein [Labilithrix luteola]|nr:AraC family transcriptional regulator [Labilithrix luteola]
MTNPQSQWSRVDALDILDVSSPTDKRWEFHWPGRLVVEPLTDGVEWHPKSETRELPRGTVLAAPAFAGHVRIHARAGASFRVIFEDVRDVEPAFYGRVHYPTVCKLSANDGDIRTLFARAIDALERTAPTSVRVSTKILRTREVLSQDLTVEMNLEALAVAVGIAPSHLCRAFRRAVGLPPYRFRAHLRIAHARLLLAAGHDCTDVAYRLGFYDQSHLSRSFKEITGTTPGTYARTCGATGASRPQLLSAA